jgi:hypothetical protein
MTTLILNRSQIEQLLDPVALLEPLRSAFLAYRRFLSAMIKR